MWSNLVTLTRYRGLIQSLVARELKARYRGSFLGFFWSFVNPLMLLTIYTFVFARILKQTDPETTPYAIFMFSGLLPWTWFSSSLMESANSLVSGGNLIKKVLFPAEVLPIVSILSNLVHFLLGLIILAGFMIWFQHFPDWIDIYWFPVIVLVQFIFTLSLGLLLSALTVHFRDIRELLGNLLTFWFFATPIIYNYRALARDESLQPYVWLFKLNPFFHLAVSYQEILFHHGETDGGSSFGHLWALLALGGASIVLFFACYWIFDRLRDSFAEAV